MPAKLPTRKNLKKQDISKEPAGNVTDLSRLAALARTMMGHLEEALQKECSDRFEDSDYLQKKYERLFGARYSWVSTLMLLAELIVKLEKTNIEKTTPSSGHLLEASGTLTAVDVALMQEFLRKAQI